MNTRAQPGQPNLPSGGPGDGSAMVQLRIIAEPVVALSWLYRSPLYRDCVGRVILPDSRQLKSTEVIGKSNGIDNTNMFDIAVLGVVLDALDDDPRAVLACTISPKTFVDQTLWEHVLWLIGQRQYLARRLILKISEASLVDDAPYNATKLADAHRLECRIAISDFGAGYALSSRIHRFDMRWDFVKIDRRLCATGRRTPIGRAGLHSIVSLAACLSPVIVIDGIETEEHLSAAKASGATHGQGSLFAGPDFACWTEFDGGPARRWAASLDQCNSEIPSPATGAGGRETAPPNLSRVERLGERVRALVARARSSARPQ